MNSEAAILPASSVFQASVTFRRWDGLSIASSASRPMKSWSNFTMWP